MTNVDIAFAEMARVLRPGGRMYHRINPFYWPADVISPDLPMSAGPMPVSQQRANRRPTRASLLESERTLHGKVARRAEA